MKETIKLGLILLLVTAVAGGVLAGVNAVTGPVIEEAKRQASFGALYEIFPDADDFIELEEKLQEIKAKDSNVLQVFESKKGEETIGFAIRTKAGGYGGDVVMLTGIDSEENIVGFKVLEMSETPGLGSRIVDDPAFAQSIEGTSAQSSVKAVSGPSADDEILLLSGATVSTNAVVAGINSAIDAYNSYLKN